jgi:acetyl esterase/lipase
LAPAASAVQEAAGAGVVDRPASAAPRPSAVTETNGEYGPSADDTVDLFSPTRPGEHPAVLFIHGGAWGRSQPLSPERVFCRQLARRTGWVVALIGYPTWTPPERRVEPAAIREALISLAADPAVDPHRVAVWGESSGGQLALLAAYRNRSDHVDLVRAVVAVSGPTAMRLEYRSAAQKDIGAVTHFEGASPRRAVARYAATSPLALARRGVPPTFQAISRHDPLVPPVQVRDLSRRLGRLGVVHRTVYVRGSDHSFPLEFDRPPGSRHTVEVLAIRFLAHVFTA